MESEKFSSSSVYFLSDFAIRATKSCCDPGSFYKMGHPMLQIGSKVRIVSKANVRYEGTFVEIDMDKLQIALCDVHFYGTEARAAEFYIAGQTRVYPFVVFKNTDIKEILVLENPLPQSPCDAYALEVSRMTSFSSSSGISSINASPFISAEPMRRPYERDLAFDDQSFYNSRVSSNNNRNFSRTSQYMWRIPRVVDYVGRSGDPKELPLISNGELIAFEQDYDFEKYNKLFVDLCGGLIDLSLTTSTTNNSTTNNNKNNNNNSSGSTANESDESQEVETNEEFAWNSTSVSSSGNNSESNKSNKTEEESIEEENDDVDDEDAVAIVETTKTVPSSKGAIPKKIAVYQSPKSIAVHSTAYDKSKSFFDTVSCSSIYRSGNINPNWREHNTETFGVPMICHQRRSPRNFRNSSKLPFVAAAEVKQQQKAQIQNAAFNNNNKPVINGRRYNNANNNNNNNNNGNHYNNNDPNVTSQFTIKKVHFKAVFMSKNSSTPTKQEPSTNLKNIQTEVDLTATTAACDEAEK